MFLLLTQFSLSLILSGLFLVCLLLPYLNFVSTISLIYLLAFFFPIAFTKLLFVSIPILPLFLSFPLQLLFPNFSLEATCAQLEASASRSSRSRAFTRTQNGMTKMPRLIEKKYFAAFTVTRLPIKYSAKQLKNVSIKHLFFTWSNQFQSNSCLIQASQN